MPSRLVGRVRPAALTSACSVSSDPTGPSGSMMSVMKGPEKQSLQEKCTAEWNAYEDAAREAGLSIDPAGYLKLPSIGELIASRTTFDPASAMRTVYSIAVRRRSELLKASRDLSRHLSTHCC